MRLSRFAAECEQRIKNMSENTTMMITKGSQILQKCTSKEPNRYALNSVYFNSSLVAATDGHQMAIARKADGEPENALIKFSAPTQKARNFPCEHYTQIDNQLIGKLDVRNTAEITEGQFPDVKLVIPKLEGKTVTICLNADLLKSLSEVVNLDESRSKYSAGPFVTITFELDAKGKAEGKPMLVTGSRADAIGVLMPARFDDDYNAKERISRVLEPTTE
jgi:DNA polymerase III sliding clamp (beta) subunit (PCNA family)